MYKEVLRTIEGVGIYPVISFVLFGSFFIGMLVYISMMKKDRVDELRNMPLEENPMASVNPSKNLAHEKVY